MFKINKIISLLIIAGFIVAFSATDSFAQKGGKGRYRKVALTKDAPKNGYKVTEPSRKQFYLQIFGAEDPLKKRVLTGEELVEYRCREMLNAIERRIFFNNGNTEPFKIECSEADLILKPQILLLDEPE
jgi:hypothetical protein